MANAVNPYGDGQAARRTVETLAWFFGLGERPDEFVEVSRRAGGGRATGPPAASPPLADDEDQLGTSEVGLTNA
jgi:hypothetical protein